MSGELRYLDTRSQRSAAFGEILLAGIAPSGGLWSPQMVPDAGGVEIKSAPPIGVEDAEPGGGRGDFCRDAAELAALWTGSWADADGLHEMFRAAWGGWAPQGPPLRQLEDDLWLMELFHGPSLSFKDFGLTFLGQCFERELKRQDRRGVVLVATSGDTGAAAVAALENLERIRLVVLLPEGRTSEVQLRQMTCGTGPGVEPVLVEGTFDDCQRMVKHCLTRPELLPQGWNFLSVNSINFGRVLAQQTYYQVAAAFIRNHTGHPPTFAVPSGNFGNAYAAWLARCGGAPIDRILIASNRNDSLHRFLTQGRLHPHPVVPTLSPAMDIALPSNLERLLFEAATRNWQRLAAWGVGNAQRELQIDDAALERLNEVFLSATQDDEATAHCIHETHSTGGPVIDPHTAVGVAAARQALRDGRCRGPVVVAATAHPCKFPEAMRSANLAPVPLPPALSERLALPSRHTPMPPDETALQAFVRTLPD